MFSTFWNFWNLVLYYPPTSGAMFGFLHFPTEVSAKQSVSNAPKGVPSMRRFWKAMVGHGRIRSFLGYDHFFRGGSCSETLQEFCFFREVESTMTPMKNKGFPQVSKCSICNDVCGVIPVSQLWHAMVMWCHFCGYLWSQEPWCLSEGKRPSFPRVSTRKPCYQRPHRYPRRNLWLRFSVWVISHWLVCWSPQILKRSRGESTLQTDPSAAFWAILWFRGEVSVWNCVFFRDVSGIMIWSW